MKPSFFWCLTSGVFLLVSHFWCLSSGISLLVSLFSLLKQMEPRVSSQPSFLCQKSCYRLCYHHFPGCDLGRGLLFSVLTSSQIVNMDKENLIVLQKIIRRVPFRQKYQLLTVSRGLTLRSKNTKVMDFEV